MFGARTGNASRDDNDVGILQGSLCLGGIRVPRATGGHEASNFLLHDSSVKMPCGMRGLLEENAQRWRRCGKGQRQRRVC